jgi:hypothetical protein
VAGRRQSLWQRFLTPAHLNGVEASDALLAIERYAGVKTVELQKIRRQDPSLGRDVEERKHIRISQGR